jgi:hypothetical protein
MYVSLAALLRNQLYIDLVSFSDLLIYNAHSADSGLGVSSPNRGGSAASLAQQITTKISSAAPVAG